MSTTANGALDLRVRDGNSLAPELLEQAVAAARSVVMARTLEAQSRVLEAKSRAIRDIVVPVMGLAAVAFVALYRRP